MLSTGKHHRAARLLPLLMFLTAALSVCPLCASTADTTRRYTMTATYYADFFVGRRTSNGEIFSHDKFTCAHKTLPLGTFVEVTNPKNSRSVILKVNDRCPKNGVLDMTRSAIEAIGIPGSGRVSVRVLSELPEGFTFANGVPAASTTSNTSSSAPSAASSSSTSATTSSTTAKAGKTAPSRKKQNNARGDRFDIALSTEHTLHKAQLHASILPPEYLQKTEYHQVANGYQIVIHLSQTEKQLAPIVEELSLSFPRLTLIKASNF